MSVFVFVQHTLVLIKLLLRICRTSKNEVLFSVSDSIVNLMFKVSSTLLMKVIFVKQIVSSTYLFHNDISLDNVGIIFRSSSTIKMFAKTVARGEPIATPLT